MEYTVILEGSPRKGFSAYSPDVPGVVATGKTELLVRRRMASGIRFHLAVLRRDGEPLPKPQAKVYKQRIDPSALTGL